VGPDFFDHTAATSQELAIAMHMPFLFDILTETMKLTEETDVPLNDTINDKDEPLMNMDEYQFEYTSSSSLAKAKKGCASISSDTSSVLMGYVPRLLPPYALWFHSPGIVNPMDFHFSTSYVSWQGVLASA
jgi:hypothetical protein